MSSMTSRTASPARLPDRPRMRSRSRRRGATARSIGSCRFSSFAARVVPIGLCRFLPVGLLEVAQIRRRLVLLGGHQQAVGTEVIDLVADAHMGIAFAADFVG